MPEPVLVIHGAANRNQASFEAMARALIRAANQAGGSDRFEAVPVFWGDIAVQSFPGLSATLPRAATPSGVVVEDAAAGRPISIPRTLLDLLDVLGALPIVNRWTEGHIQQLRRDLLRPRGAETGLSDIFIYMAHREAIQERLRSRWASAAPVAVAAHSLGAIITVDAAIDSAAPLDISRLFSFGTQVSVLHVLDPDRLGVAPYRLPRYVSGQRVAVPHIGRWTNVWHAMDPLAFLMAGIFSLASGGPVDDLALEGGIWRVSQAHGSYWTHPRVAQLLWGALTADGALDPTWTRPPRASSGRPRCRSRGCAPARR
ncbi:MAG: hypothetical protein ACXWPO_08170 [Candidatus Limnocylindrales bacterium]